MILLVMKFTAEGQRAIRRAIDGKVLATWLTVLLLATCHFDLTPAQLRDGVT